MPLYRLLNINYMTDQQTFPDKSIRKIKMNCRLQKLLMAACVLFVLAETASAQEAEIEKAFVAISELSGFQTYNRKQMIEEMGWNEDDPSISPELGDIKVTIHGNADLRVQFLAILDNIPANFLYSEMRDERDKITRFYIQTDTNGVGYLLYTFVGQGGNDTVAILYKGGDEATYKRLVDGVK